jgi:GNAT superfamily N-acetyltransferase
MSEEGATLSDDEVERVLANRNAAYTVWARNFPHPRVRTLPGLHLVDSGIASTELNVAFVIRPDLEPQRALTVARDFFVEHPSAWRIEVPTAVRGKWEGPVVAAGLSQLEVRPAMVLLEGEPRVRPAGAELSIVPVGSPADSERFVRALAAGFGFVPRPEALTARFDGPAERTSYLGVVGGRDVATAVGYRHRGVTGIYAVATVESARRKGYGSALTARAIADGRAAGCPLAFLQASTMGAPVYEAMGFRRVFETLSWSPPRD